MMMKVRHEPFSVYMFFLKPYQGREVLFVNGDNNNEMLVLEAGWKRKKLGWLQLYPTRPAGDARAKAPHHRSGDSQLDGQADRDRPGRDAVHGMQRHD